MINTKTGKAGLHIQGVHAPSSNGKSFSLSTICDRKLNVTAQKNDIMDDRLKFMEQERDHMETRIID